MGRSFLLAAVLLLGACGAPESETSTLAVDDYELYGLRLCTPDELVVVSSRVEQLFGADGANNDRFVIAIEFRNDGDVPCSRPHGWEVAISDPSGNSNIAAANEETCDLNLECFVLMPGESFTIDHESEFRLGESGTYTASVTLRAALLVSIDLEEIPAEPDGSYREETYSVDLEFEVS